MVVERTSMGKAMKRENNPDWREGRKLKEIDNEQFERLAQNKKTVSLPWRTAAGSLVSAALHGMIE